MTCRSEAAPNTTAAPESGAAEWTAAEWTATDQQAAEMYASWWKPAPIVRGDANDYAPRFASELARVREILAAVRFELAGFAAFFEAAQPGDDVGENAIGRLRCALPAILGEKGPCCLHVSRVDRLAREVKHHAAIRAENRVLQGDLRKRAEEVIALIRWRDAWRTFAEHVEHCRGCAEDGREQCRNGNALYERALHGGVA